MPRRSETQIRCVRRSIGTSGAWGTPIGSTACSILVSVQGWGKPESEFDSSDRSGVIVGGHGER